MNERTALEVLMEEIGLEIQTWDLLAVKNVSEKFMEMMEDEKQKLLTSEPLDQEYYQCLNNLQMIGAALGTLAEMKKNLERPDAEETSMVTYIQVPKEWVPLVGDRLREYGLYAGRVLAGTERPSDQALADGSAIGYTREQIRQGTWELDTEQDTRNGIWYFLAAIYPKGQLSAAYKEVFRNL